jgi:hypothetical protein
MTISEHLEEMVGEMNEDDSQKRTFLEALRRDDEETRECRTNIIRCLEGIWIKDRWIGFQGDIPLRAYEESRRCYINGEYLGCVLLCQLTLEHMLAGYLHMGGKDILRKGFRYALRRACEVGMISNEEYDELDQLRKWRDIYTHFRNPIELHIAKRTVQGNTGFPDKLKDDANTMLSLMISILARRPFSLGG